MLDRYSEDKMRGAQAISTARDVEVSYRDSIQQEIDHLEKIVARKKEMIKLLDENPAIEKFMNLSRG